MAVTSIANIIDPEILMDQVNATFFDELALQPVVTPLNSRISEGGQFLDMPSWNIASTAAQELTEGVSLTPKAMNAKKERGVVVRRGDAWSNYDTASLVSLSDPQGELRSQFARITANAIDDSLISVVKGATQLEEDDSGATITVEGIFDAKQKAGDQSRKFDGGVIVMNSKVANDLNKLGAVTYVDSPNVGGVLLSGRWPVIAGMVVRVSDRLVVDTGVYSSYLIAPGALALGMQRTFNFETDRDILAKSDDISYDVHFVPHLKGVDYTGGALPSEADLANVANWTLKAENANLTGVVRLKTL